MDETAETLEPSTDVSFGDENGKLRVSKQQDGTWYLDFTFDGRRNNARTPNFNPGGVVASLTSLSVGVSGLKDAIEKGEIEVPQRVEGHTKTTFLVNLFKGIDGVHINEERDIMGKRVVSINMEHADPAERKTQLMGILDQLSEKLNNTQATATNIVSARSKS